MPSPRLYAGQILTADRWNAALPLLVMQENDQTVTSATTGTTLINSEITFTPEINATYQYELLLSYSATVNSDFKWAWDAAHALFCSFTLAYASGVATGVNTGGDTVLRRPGNTTGRIAGGTDAAATTPVNFHSAYDRGTFATDGTVGTITMQFAQNTSSTDQTILRGGNQTRILYRRIA
ncbi:hypothetical protein [Streptomyces sp. NPDC005970]|uniref:hypothetical protein n=1 Tax=Streptomyces sp. NPDC005970 TaxID=3156723 RepID=UPI0033E20AE1